jgi:hypothetical protein
MAGGFLGMKTIRGFIQFSKSDGQMGHSSYWGIDELELLIKSLISDGFQINSI